MTCNLSTSVHWPIQSPAYDCTGGKYHPAIYYSTPFCCRWADWISQESSHHILYMFNWWGGMVIVPVWEVVEQFARACWVAWTSCSLAFSCSEHALFNVPSKKNKCKWGNPYHDVRSWVCVGHTVSSGRQHTNDYHLHEGKTCCHHWTLKRSIRIPQVNLSWYHWWSA